MSRGWRALGRMAGMKLLELDGVLEGGVQWGKSSRDVWRRGWGVL